MKINKLKTNNYGFGHMEIILVVLVVAIIGVVGFTVFNNHKTSSSLKATAQAGSWTLLFPGYPGDLQDAQIYACKIPRSTAKNPTKYLVKFLFTKPVTAPNYNYGLKKFSIINGTTKNYPTQTGTVWQGGTTVILKTTITANVTYTLTPFANTINGIDQIGGYVAAPTGQFHGLDTLAHC